MAKTAVYSFFQIDKDRHRPMIPIKIINPVNNEEIKAWGLLDTGADKCLFPKGICDVLKIDIKTGRQDGATGIEGNSMSTWVHPFKVQLLDPKTGEAIWKSKEIQIGCCEHDNAPILLGWENCMQCLSIRFNYPTKRIVIEVP